MLANPEAGAKARLSFTGVKNLRQVTFALHGTSQWEYGIDRGAFGTDPYVSYEPNLPIFILDNQIVTWRDALYDVVKQARLEGRKSRILDIGCGTARALRDLDRRFNQRSNWFSRSLFHKKEELLVELTGISAFDWRSNRQRRSDEEREITYLIYDTQNLSHSMLEGFDSVVSVKTLRYLGDPLTAIRGSYRLLKPGGFGFLDAGMLSRYFSSPEDYALLQAFWGREYGFQFNRGGIAFQGSGQHLTTPVRLAGDWTVGDGERRARYEFRV
ncbi:MAG: hypothetical protein G01um10147_822 [Microgenomates group bacterium Gr01-1014_7]|nr:MAG: hypothetical protein G01um10147_822 [Microgenomates group bacterium Gr01-1014_7]